MKCKMEKGGAIFIIPENEMESYALTNWLKDGGVVGVADYSHKDTPLSAPEMARKLKQQEQVINSLKRSLANRDSLAALLSNVKYRDDTVTFLAAQIETLKQMEIE